MHHLQLIPQILSRQPKPMVLHLFHTSLLRYLWTSQRDPRHRYRRPLLRRRGPRRQLQSVPLHVRTARNPVKPGRSSSYTCHEFTRSKLPRIPSIVQLTRSTACRPVLCVFTRLPVGKWLEKHISSWSCSAMPLPPSHIAVQDLPTPCAFLHARAQTTPHRCRYSVARDTPPFETLPPAPLSHPTQMPSATSDLARGPRTEVSPDASSMLAQPQSLPRPLRHQCLHVAFRISLRWVPLWSSRVGEERRHAKSDPPKLDAAVEVLVLFSRHRLSGARNPTVQPVLCHCLSTGTTISQAASVRRSRLHPNHNCMYQNALR